MSDPIAPFLAQFPGPLLLRSPLGWRRAAMWCIIWPVVGSVEVLRAFGDPPAKDRDGMLVLGLIMMIIGAIGPWWYCAGALLLDHTGFIYKWPFWQSRTFPWIDVDRSELRKSRRFFDEDFSKLTGNLVFDYAPREGTWKGKWTKAIRSQSRPSGHGDQYRAHA